MENWINLKVDIEISDPWDVATEWNHAIMGKIIEVQVKTDRPSLIIQLDNEVQFGNNKYSYVYAITRYVGHSFSTLDLNESVTCNFVFIPQEIKYSEFDPEKWRGRVHGLGVIGEIKKQAK